MTTSFGDIRNVHSPIQITKLIDKATPLIAQAWSKQEIVNCNISFYRTNPNGFNERFFTIQLKGARIVDVSLSLPHVIKMKDADMQETISLRYKDISWEHVAGTSGYDFWELLEWDGK
ncbi:type VI secretion system tube protein Hcp [Photobacterium indicum]